MLTAVKLETEKFASSCPEGDKQRILWECSVENAESFDHSSTEAQGNVRCLLIRYLIEVLFVCLQLQMKSLTDNEFN